jgi:hypothetical protein
MTQDTDSFNPQTVDARNDLLLARPDGVARQEVSGQRDLAADAATTPGWAAATDMPTHRSDVSERRSRLRHLDIALGSEIEDAGALTFAELCRHVEARDLLGAPATDATLWEWWSYARRRDFIVAHDDGQCRLSPEAKHAIATRRTRESLRFTPSVRAIARTAPPTGWLSLVIATAALSSTNPSALTVFVAVLGGLAMTLIGAAFADVTFVARIDKRLDQRALAWHVGWLNGDALPRLGLARSQPAVAPGTMHRLHCPPIPNPEHSGAA